MEAEVQSTTDAQFYTLASPYGDPVVRRRRYTQTLGLGVYDIGADGVGFGPRLSFKLRMRLDSDFGQEGAELSPNNAGRFIPGLQQSPVDVMYAYLEGERYLGGWLGFRLGRQYTTDALGWWSFDGGLLRVTTPAYFQVEAYGGFEQRGGLPALLATSRYTADGVYRGNRSELEAAQYPYFLEESKPAPAYGFAIETSGVSWVHGRLSYRKVINRDTVVVSPFADAGGGFVTVGGDRVSSERIGYSARVSSANLGAVRGSVVYDFYNQIFSEHALAADWYTTDKITVGADYDYYFPTFDADSIFNWFTHDATTTYLGRAEYRHSRRFDVALSGGARVFRTEGNADSYASTLDRSASGVLVDALGNVGGRYRWQEGGVELRSVGETGDRGHRVGGDITTRQAFDDGLYDAMVMLSLYDWSDALRPQRDATSFSYVLGGGYSPLSRTRLGLEWEHDMNRLVGQRYRVLATVDVTVLK
jgi:hypothetical protein